MKGKISNKIIDIILTSVVIVLTLGIIALQFRVDKVEATYPTTSSSSSTTLTKEDTEEDVEKVEATKESSSKSEEETNKEETKKEENTTNNGVVASSNGTTSNGTSNSTSASTYNGTSNSNINNNVVSNTNNQPKQTQPTQPAQPAQQPVVEQTPEPQPQPQPQPAPQIVNQVGSVFLNHNGGNISTDRATYLNNCRGYIPSVLLNAFDTVGYKIEIGYYGQGWAGLFKTKDKKIYVDNGTSMDIGYVLTHESGHFLDTIKKYSNSGLRSSQTNEFTNIFNEERLNISPRYSGNYNYFISSASEYYAECFSQYLLDNGKLAANNPKTYAFIQNDLNTITAEEISYFGRIYG